ncbi:MAG: transglutaminase family protein [Candidatus Woesebacteria bacterium]|nr:transglutaminase family protein [Candidatus Woesebacteria bacterium]
MFKKFWVLLLCTMYFVLCTSHVHAEGEFRTDVDVTYKVQETGITTVTNKITLENLFTNLYATSYTLILDNIKPANLIVSEVGKNLPFEVKTDGSKTNIVISFPNSLVGKGNKRIFSVSYDDSTIAQRTGEVWEISIPRLSSDSSFTLYNLSFLVPNSFGEEAYISPSPERKEIKDGFKVYTFNKEVASKTGIMAGFGQFQVFSFNLIYHLENPLVKSASVEIALPPDTSLQKVYFSQINPKPNNIRVDDDGNWLGTFTLTPRQRVDIKVEGSVQIFAGSRPFPQPQESTLANNLLPTDFWQVNDPVILELAHKYKTPKEIYDFVVNYLSYDFERVKPNVIRLGALEALKNPKNAICMEFTDLFIAVSRAAKIPAREINGFAYTENPKIQPLSLVSDILHAWPEYWDSNKKTWVAIDPTWGSTTGGIDFFNKLDLRHFAFVIHGADSQKPYPPGSYKLGPNPQKDIFVNFGQLPLDRNPKIKIVSEVEKFIPFAHQKIMISIENTGVAASYNLNVQMFFDNKLIETKNIQALPPYGKFSFTIKVPFSFLGKNTPNIIKITASDEKLEIQSAKAEVIIYNLASIFLISLVITLGILFKLGKIKIPKIKKLFAGKSGNIQIP